VPERIIVSEMKQGAATLKKAEHYKRNGGDQLRLGKKEK
jgi:hypothetical protein